MARSSDGIQQPWSRPLSSLSAAAHAEAVATQAKQAQAALARSVFLMSQATKLPTMVSGGTQQEGIHNHRQQEADQSKGQTLVNQLKEQAQAQEHASGMAAATLEERTARANTASESSIPAAGVTASRPGAAPTAAAIACNDEQEVAATAGKMDVTAVAEPAAEEAAMDEPTKERELPGKDQASLEAFQRAVMSLPEVELSKLEQLLAKAAGDDDAPSSADSPEKVIMLRSK